MSIENLMFSAGGGFLFGGVAGYAIKKSNGNSSYYYWIVYGWSLISIIQRMG
jgi:uncharacterized membrane protein (Fun14 family)